MDPIGDFGFKQTNEKQKGFIYAIKYVTIDSFLRLTLALMIDGLDIPALCEYMIVWGY